MSRRCCFCSSSTRTRCRTYNSAACFTFQPPLQPTQRQAAATARHSRSTSNSALRATRQRQRQRRQAPTASRSTTAPSRCAREEGLGLWSLGEGHCNEHLVLSRILLLTRQPRHTLPYFQTIKSACSSSRRRPPARLRSSSRASSSSSKAPCRRRRA